MAMMRTLLVLGRVSNLPTVWTNCLAGWVIAGLLFESSAVLALHAGALTALLLGTSLLYVGGMVFNDVCDVAWDREHAKERPIPAGKITRGRAAALGVLCLVAGVVAILWAEPSAGWLVGALLGAILLYDLVHKRWAGAVLMMGACRFLLYVLASFVSLGGALTGGPGTSAHSPFPLLIAATGLFGYVVGITVAARGESTGGSVSGWAWLLLVSPVVAWLGAGGGGPGVWMVGIFGGWLWRCALHLRGESPARVGKFVGGLLAGIVLVDAMMASTADWKAAVICVLFLPVTLGLQRYVPAT